VKCCFWFFFPPHAPLPLPTWNLFPCPRAYILDSRIQSQPLSTKCTMQHGGYVHTVPIVFLSCNNHPPCLQYERHIHVTKSGESLVRISSNNWTSQKIELLYMSLSLSSVTVAAVFDILSTTVGIDYTCLDGSNMCMYTILFIPSAWKLNQSISSITPNSKGAMIWSWCA
jgi:hypothetical protein